MVDSNIYTSGEYANKNQSFHIEDSPWKAQQILQMMQKHHLKVSSLCEVGCGAGGILDTLQQSLPKTVNLFGYEISPQAFELAQTRTNERLHFFCDDLLTSKHPTI